MGIAEFNSANGTSYTKDSFAKLFNQYFPHGMSGGESLFEKQYQTMYKHALRFSVRSHIFNTKGKDVELGKMSYDLNNLFKEEIKEYNEKVPSSKSIKFLENGGLTKQELKGSMLEYLADIPKTQMEEEVRNIRKNISSDLSMTPEENYNRAAQERIEELFTPDKGINKEEAYSRSIDVIRAMEANHALHEKSFRPRSKKAQEEIKGIEEAKDLIKDNGYTLNEINNDVKKPTEQTPFFESIVNSIDGFKPPMKDATIDFRRKLEEDLGPQVAPKTQQVAPQKTFGDPTINFNK